MLTNTMEIMRKLKNKMARMNHSKNLECHIEPLLAEESKRCQLFYSAKPDFTS